MRKQDVPSVQAIGNDELVIVTHVLPAHVAVAFQREAGAILERIHRSGTGAAFDESTWDSTQFVPPFNSNHRGDEDAWSLPVITDDDRKAVAWVVDNWTDTGRALVAALLQTSADGVHTFDLAASVGYEGGVPSAFRGIAGRLRAIERSPFWKGDPDTVRHERGQVLSLDPDRGSGIVREVMEARFPELFRLPAGDK